MQREQQLLACGKIRWVCIIKKNDYIRPVRTNQISAYVNLSIQTEIFHNKFPDR